MPIRIVDRALGDIATVDVRKRYAEGASRYRGGKHLESIARDQQDLGTPISEDRHHARKRELDRGGHVLPKGAHPAERPPARCVDL
jgi:hypothetical protein